MTTMPIHPVNRTYNITSAERVAARETDKTYVRADGTLRKAGQRFVAGIRLKDSSTADLEMIMDKWVPEFPELEDEEAELLGRALIEWASR